MYQDSLMHGSRLFAGPPWARDHSCPARSFGQTQLSPDSPFWDQPLGNLVRIMIVPCSVCQSLQIVSYHGDLASSGRSGMRFKPEVIRSGDYLPSDGLIDSLNPILHQLDWIVIHQSMIHYSCFMHHDCFCSSVRP